MSDERNLRINPTIRRLVCSASGREVDHHDFERPIGLCACCPPPGRPVVVEYDLGASAERMARELRGRTEMLARATALSADGATWSYAYLTMIVILAPAVMDGIGGGPAGAKFLDRLIMFFGTAIYAVVAVPLGLEPIEDPRRRGHDDGHRRRLELHRALGQGCAPQQGTVIVIVGLPLVQASP